MKMVPMMRSLLAFAALSLVPAPVLSFVSPVVGRCGFLRSPTQLNMVANGQDAKVILITGSSQGLGQAMAYEMAKEGHTIIVNHIVGCEQDAEETIKQISLLGGRAMAIQADCSDPEQVRNMFQKAHQRFGKIDVLVNNAGVTRDGLVARMKPKDWNLVLSVNLSGVFYCSQEFFKYAVERGQGGRVVNIASVVGQIGNPGQCNYAASKGGVIALTKSCAQEFAKDNIKVNAICPGFIQTAMTQKMGQDQLDEIASHIPLGRLGLPKEVAAMARFLALDEGADYITGHTFDVDGGVGIAAS